MLSESVANALKHVGGEEVAETVQFIKMIDKFFDTLNVTNFSSGKLKRKPFKDPYKPSTDGKQDFCLKVYYLYIYVGSMIVLLKYLPLHFVYYSG